MTDFATSERRGPLAVGLVLATTLIAFEVTAVITALPTVSDELGGDSLYGATLAAYTLANIVSLVTVGGLIDSRGPRLPYAISLGLFWSVFSSRPPHHRCGLSCSADSFKESDPAD